MKKVIGVSFSLLCFALAVYSQKLAAAKVPAAVKAGFTKAYPGKVAAWELENKNYEANFKNGTKTTSVIIDKQGTIVETETEITMSELPSGARSYISNHLKGKKIKETAKIVKANGDVVYEVAVAGGDFMFDSNGKMIEKKKE
jgi:uncharacterized membrane protein YkoI